MNATQAVTLLAYITSVDPRWSQLPDEEASIRATAWATVLEDVDPVWAMAHTKRYYSREQSYQITPGGIRAAWMTTQRVEGAKARQAPEEVPGVPVPPNLSAYMREVLAISQAGGDPTTVPRPASARHMTVAEDIRSRLCRYWKGCACDHKRCRDGWLDEAQHVIGTTGLTYEQVEPCPHCHDAAIMAAEPVMKRGRR